MSRIPKWKIEKTKVKVVFRLQFHATHIPQQGWDKLFVSFIPIDSGKATAKTNKVNVKNGSCKWPDPIYETTRLLQDSRTKTYDDKTYKIVVAMGSSRSSFLGEVNINLAEFSDALKPSSVSLPLTNCDFGTILHITVQLLTSKTGFREFEQQRELSVKGIQMISSHKNDSLGASSEITNEVVEKGLFGVLLGEPDATASFHVSIQRRVINNIVTMLVSERARFKEDRTGLPSLEQMAESNEDYEDSSYSAGGIDGSSFTSESLHGEKNDHQIMHEIDNFKSIMHSDVPHSQSTVRGNDSVAGQFSAQGSNDWTRGWSSNYSVENDLSTAYAENNRLRVRLEVAESAFFQLKLEAKSLQRITDDLGSETQSLSKQLSVELASGEQLTREISLLKLECAKFRDDLEALKSAKMLLRSPDQRAYIPLMLNHGHDNDLVDVKLQSDVTAEETHLMYHDLRIKWLENLLLIEGKVREIQNKTHLRNHGSDFDFLNPDFELLGCVIGDLKEDIIQVKGLERSYGDNKYLGGAVHHLDVTNTVYHVNNTDKKLFEASSRRREDNTFNLLSRLDELTTEKESLAKKMEQMQCYYESIILELEEGQKQTIKELENLRNEHSSSHYSISVLQNQIEKLHQEMNEQFIAFADDRSNLESQNKELERRAIASETALKRVRWNYSIAVDRLQKDLELLSFQVLSMYETNENLAKQAFTDAYQNYNEECQEETRTYALQDGIVTLADQEHYQSGVSRIHNENGLYGTNHRCSPLDNGISASVLCKNNDGIAQVGVPLHLQLQRKDETQIDEFSSTKIRQQTSHHVPVKNKFISLGTHRDEIPIEPSIITSKLDARLSDDAEAIQSPSLYLDGDRQKMAAAVGIEEIKSIQMLKVLNSDAEAELSEMHKLNMDLKVFSEILFWTLHDVNDGVWDMKRKMLELTQQLQHAEELKESFMLKLLKEVDNSRILMDDKAKCISRCEDVTLKNQILEAKLQVISDENTFFIEKIAEYERMVVKFKSYEQEYKEYIQERDEFKILLEEESLQIKCLETELAALKEEFQKKSSENDKMETCIAFIQEKLGHLCSCTMSYNEHINCSALCDISISQALEDGNYMAVITTLEQFQQEAVQKLRQLHEEKMDLKEQREISLSLKDKTEIEYLNMKQKFESDLNEITGKLEKSNAQVEKLQLELQIALDKLKICSDCEEKNELRNRELSSKLTNLEIELQLAVDENKDLVNQLVLLAGVKDDLEKAQISLHNCMQEKRALLISMQSRNEALTQMENELHSLKEKLQFTETDLGKEKRMREELDATVASLAATLEEKDAQLLSFYEQKNDMAHLQNMVMDLGKTNTEFQLLLLKSEEMKGSLDCENLSLKLQIQDMGNQLVELLENSLSGEVKITFIRSYFDDRMKQSSVQLDTLVNELEELNLKYKKVVALLDTHASNETKLIDESARLSVALQSLQSEYDIIFQEKESLIDYVKRKDASWTELEDETCQLKNIVISCEEEVCNLRSSRDALEVSNMVLQSKLNEQQKQISLLEECEYHLRDLREQDNDLSCKLSEQILKTEEYKNLSIHLRELKDKAEAECLQAREKKENERASQDSLRIAFIKEQYECKIQELKNQLYVSKKYAEEMLLKLQNALDEVESRKKTEVSLLKKIEELSEKISNSESELDAALTDRKELVKSYDSIRNELECSILNLDCCKEEKVKLEESLKECNEERTKSRVELDLVKQLFENIASSEPVNLEGNSDYVFPTTASIEQILQDGSFGFSAIFKEMPNDRVLSAGMEGPSGSDAISLKAIDVELQKTSDTLSSRREVEALFATCADESSLSSSLSSSHAFKDGEGALEQQTSFADNTTDIASIEEHFKEQQQKLKSGIDMLQKELEKLRNENLSSLMPLQDHQSIPSLQDLERDLSQLDMANEQLGSIFPLFKELPGSGNALERVLALELELAEALQTKKSDLRLQSSFIKQHNDDEAVFQSFRDINELIKEMLELKSRNAAVETELKEMQGRYSQLSLQFAEVEGERQKLIMTMKSRVPKRS